LRTSVAHVTGREDGREADADATASWAKVPSSIAEGVTIRHTAS
jgi:hypothetical protein